MSVPMDASGLLIKVRQARELFTEGQASHDSSALEEALKIALEIREFLDINDTSEMQNEIDQFEDLDMGLNAFIFNCMELLGHHDRMLPFLERAIHYLDNERKPDLWRQLGLLYLAQKKDIDKACDAWKRAIELDPSILERCPGLNLVHAYEALKKAGKKPRWKLLHADLKTGEFSVTMDSS